MKQYNEVIIKGLSFSEAKRYIENYKGYTFITRPEWKGFHFIDVYGNWCIYTRFGSLLKNVSLETVMCQGKMDWMAVEPNEMAIKSIADHIDLYKMQEDNMKIQLWHVVYWCYTIYTMQMEL